MSKEVAREETPDAGAAVKADEDLEAVSGGQAAVPGFDGTFPGGPVGDDVYVDGEYVPPPQAGGWWPNP